MAVSAAWCDTGFTLCVPGVVAVLFEQHCSINTPGYFHAFHVCDWQDSLRPPCYGIKSKMAFAVLLVMHQA